MHAHQPAFPLPKYATLGQASSVPYPTSNKPPSLSATSSAASPKAPARPAAVTRGLRTLPCQENKGALTGVCLIT